MPVLTEPTVGAPPPIVPPPPEGGDGRNDNRDRGQSNAGAARFAIYIGMFASTMTFLALAAAMFFRRGLHPGDWRHLPVPPLLWINTAALVASSVAIDLGRRDWKAGRAAEFKSRWLIGTALGTWFLVGQSINWGYLVSHGIYMQRNPASAFFYVLTWAHAAHVVGALVALYLVSWRLLRTPNRPQSANMVEVGAIFWHFLDLMWIGLMAIFALWA